MKSSPEKYLLMMKDTEFLEKTEELLLKDEKVMVRVVTLSRVFENFSNSSNEI